MSYSGRLNDALLDTTPDPSLLLGIEAHDFCTPSRPCEQCADLDRYEDAYLGPDTPLALEARDARHERARLTDAEWLASLVDSRNDPQYQEATVKTDATPHALDLRAHRYQPLAPPARQVNFAPTHVTLPELLAVHDELSDAANCECARLRQSTANTQHCLDKMTALNKEQDAMIAGLNQAIGIKNKMLVAADLRIGDLEEALGDAKRLPRLFPSATSVALDAWGGLTIYEGKDDVYTLLCTPEDDEGLSASDYEGVLGATLRLILGAETAADLLAADKDDEGSRALNLAKEASHG